MTVPQGVAIVVAVVQFCKKLLPTLIQGVVAQILAVVVSAGVTAYKVISEGGVFNFAAITFFVEVLVGAIGAYGLIKVAGGSNEAGGSATSNPS